MITKAVDEILVLFDRAVSQDRSFNALREHLDGAKPMAQYLRLLAADAGKIDQDASNKLGLTLAELRSLQQQILLILKQSLDPTKV